MSPTRSGYREFGLELVSLDHSHHPKWPPMVEEKINDGAEDPIKSLLKEALAWQRDDMMDSFVDILLRMPTMGNSPWTRKCLGDETPFKVQVDFDIPLFQGQIVANSLDTWLNVLEGYFSVHYFSTGKKSPLRSLRQSPMSKIGGILIGRKIHQTILECLRQNPLGPLS